MIQNDEELMTTLGRIARFQMWLMDMRKRTPPQEFMAMSSGYCLEIERMQGEVLDYLLSPAIALPPKSYTQTGQPTALQTGVV